MTSNRRRRVAFASQELPVAPRHRPFPPRHLPHSPSRPKPPRISTAPGRSQPLSLPSLSNVHRAQVFRRPTATTATDVIRRHTRINLAQLLAHQPRRWMTTTKRAPSQIQTIRARVSLVLVQIVQPRHHHGVRHLQRHRRTQHQPTRKATSAPTMPVETTTRRVSHIARTYCALPRHLVHHLVPLSRLPRIRLPTTTMLRPRRDMFHEALHRAAGMLLRVPPTIAQMRAISASLTIPIPATDGTAIGTATRLVNPILAVGGTAIGTATRLTTPIRAVDGTASGLATR